MELKTGRDQYLWGSGGGGSRSPLYPVGEGVDGFFNKPRAVLWLRRSHSNTFHSWHLPRAVEFTFKGVQSIVRLQLIVGLLQGRVMTHRLNICCPLN